MGVVYARHNDVALGPRSGRTVLLGLPEWTRRRGLSGSKAPSSGFIVKRWVDPAVAPTLICSEIRPLLRFASKPAPKFEAPLTRPGVPLIARMRRPLANAAFTHTREAVHSQSAIFVGAGTITASRRLSSTRSFGLVDVDHFFTSVEGHSEIADACKAQESAKNTGKR